MGLYNKKRKKILYRLEVLKIIPSLEEAHRYDLTEEVSAAIAEKEKQEARAAVEVEQKVVVKEKPTPRRRKKYRKSTKKEK